MQRLAVFLVSLAFLSSVATVGFLIYRAATNQLTVAEYLIYAYGWKDLLNNVDVKALMKLTIIGQIFSCALFVLQYLFLASYILYDGMDTFSVTVR